jgi:hypothetical protein
MNYAFSEHSLFSLPIDGFETKEKIRLRSEDETSISSLHSNAEEEVCSDLNINMSQITLKAPPLLLDGHLTHLKKRLLLNTAVGIFYECYRPDQDKLDANCMSYLIIKSIKGTN